MNIAMISSTERGETDRLISEVAKQLQAEGASLVGIVKVLHQAEEFENGCEAQVCVLPAGPVIPITQSLGKGSDSCRLDPGAIARAVSEVERSEIAQADLFVLNKFGPEESAGRGFCAVIGSALEQGVPVLVGAGAGSREAFASFVDGLAETLPADQNAILAWCKEAMATARMTEDT